MTRLTERLVAFWHKRPPLNHEVDRTVYGLDAKLFHSWLAACLAAFMFSTEISSVPVILPTLEKVLHGDFADMQWVMNAYIIACTTILMAAGTLADRYGRKRVFIFSPALFGVASLICGMAQSVAALIASRFLQRVGGDATRKRLLLGR